MLRYLDAREIKPGAALRVTAMEPFGGPITVSVGGGEHALGGELVRRMRISRQG
jgi:Fe2+ transport system protein FeoA